MPQHLCRVECHKASFKSSGPNVVMLMRLDTMQPSLALSNGESSPIWEVYLVSLPYRVPQAIPTLMLGRLEHMNINPVIARHFLSGLPVSSTIFRKVSVASLTSFLLRRIVLPIASVILLISESLLEISPPAAARYFTQTHTILSG